MPISADTRGLGPMTRLALLLIAFALPVAASAQARPLPLAADGVFDPQLLPAGCEPTKVRIDAAAPKSGDGNNKAPFATLRDALTQAENDKACAVYARIAPGDYVEGPLTVRVPTMLVGLPGVRVQGSFEVLAPTFVLSGITVIGDLKSPQPAVLAKGVAYVGLRDVNFFAFCGHGIRLDGPGAMRAVGIVVSNVCYVPDDPASGSAIHLTGGVDAELSFVTLETSVRGLYAGDAGTRVRADFVRVANTSIHPTRLANIAAAGSCGALGFQYLSAVEIDSGAELTGSVWEISRSQLAGLYAHDGGSASLGGVLITDTEDIRSGGVSCGGAGAIVHRGGSIDLKGFTIRNSYLCGVVVGSLLAEMDLLNGLIDTAPVGACVQQVGFDTSRLRHDVEYVNVGVPLQATSYDLPDGPPH
jgi:hypothetical protein